MATPQRPLLAIEQVSKIYPSGETALTALNQISLDIGSSEFLAVMGKSGSGKSTLLHLLGGLDWPSSGRVLSRGRDLAGLSRPELARWRGEHIGFVFQTFNLIPTMTAAENVELPLLLAGLPVKARRARALDLLDQVELSGRGGQKPPKLSGGEQQRVAIARALAADPEIILADEPTGNLDSESAAVVLGLLAGLNQAGKTVVLATHDMQAAPLAHRVILLRDGSLVSDSA